ncbi:Rv1733c family protein [Actinomadura rupiterrae]|uniref:Rv1733c family protein n=1 Tax=Actinomadura rupiterrae TaxID=559627 RepID=UPI0020A305DE|nr:hypothetical protein [Actinomadura rupiterrae]MCP2338710.1 hypothetical protein [Actinomadura rupiterrae]
MSWFRSGARRHAAEDGDARQAAGARLRRWARRAGLLPSELRRPVDRVQRAIAYVLLGLVLIAAPLAALSCATWSYRAGMKAEHAERSVRYHAVATAEAIGVGPAGDRYVHETLRAHWTAPDGSTRVGVLTAWKNAKAGSHHRIWVDLHGNATTPPRPHGRTVTDTVYAATGAGLAVALPVFGVYLAVRRRCDRYRDTLWDDDWARMDADAGHNRPS